MPAHFEGDIVITGISGNCADLEHTTNQFCYRNVMH